MNLHFHPIVMFEKSWPFPTSHLRDIRWKIYADSIGSYEFDIELEADSPFDVKGDRNCIKFHLKRMCVPFQHDDYECNIVFSATLDSPQTRPVEIEQAFWGVVKTIWSIGPS